MSSFNDRLARLLVELEEDLPAVYADGSTSGLYNTVAEIGGGMYNASIGVDGITLAYDTEADVGRRVCAYAHEVAHKYTPELASSSQTECDRAREELVIEYITEHALDMLTLSDNDDVRVAAQAGLDAQRRRGIGQVYSPIDGTWERYQSGDGKGLYDTVFDKLIGALFTLPEAAETATRSYVGAFLGGMGAPAVVDKSPKVAKATRALVDAAHADFKKWAADMAAPARGK